MKKFYLLRLQYNANKAVGECLAETSQSAAEKLQPNCPLPLKDGYALDGSVNDFHHVSYTVAESFA